MRNIKNDMLLGCSIALFSLILNTETALAAGCIDGSCEGYTKTAAECSGKNAIRCPFDTSKYFCLNTTCGENEEYCEAKSSCMPTCKGYTELASSSGLSGGLALGGDFIITEKPAEMLCLIGQTVEYCYDCAGTRYAKCVGVADCESGRVWCPERNTCTSTCSGYSKDISSCSSSEITYVCQTCDGTVYRKCSIKDSSGTGGTGNTGGSSGGGSSAEHPCYSNTSCWDFCACMKRANMLGDGNSQFQIATGGSAGVSNAMGDCRCAADGKPF